MAMTGLKDLIQDPPVHERKLEILTYPVVGERLIVEGRLKDEGLVPGYHWDGRPRPPGVVHWMCVRLLLGGWPLTILDAEAEMPKVPYELCQTTLDAVQRLVGLSVVSGYSEEVRQRLGGVHGCAHLTHLIATMGPAALHGYWTQRSRRPRPLPSSVEELPGFDTLVNSCKLWREEGPLVQDMRETLKRRRRKAD